jgi:hypothetical protein
MAVTAQEQHTISEEEPEEDLSLGAFEPDWAAPHVKARASEDRSRNRALGDAFRYAMPPPPGEVPPGAMEFSNEGR